MSIINEEIDTEFQELFGKISIETTLDEYIDFDAETVTSEPAVNSTQVDWQQECQEESILSLLLLLLLLSSLLLLSIFC